MPHNVENVASTQIEWHRLGQRVEPGLAPDEIMHAASLDWTVSKRSMYFDTPNDPDGELSLAEGEEVTETALCEVAGRAALVRDSDGAFLDIVGVDWHPLQNDTAFEVFNRFCEAGELTMEVAGCLTANRGLIVWGLAKMTDAIDLDGDTVDQYVLLTNPHRYGKAITAHFTPVRVVCQNTMTIALGVRATEEFARFAHNQAFSGDNFEQALESVAQTSKTYGDAARRLAATKWTEGDATAFLNRVFADAKARKATGAELQSPLSPTVTRLLETLSTQPGADLHPDTAWAAFNAVTFETNHTAGRQASTRMMSTWFGKNARTNQRALSVALDMVGAS